MSQTIIKVENLSKRFTIGKKIKPHSFFESISSFFNRKNSQNEFWALKNINFEVKEGEVLGIIGANGAGKSTLLKILSHITPPTTGKIQIKGRVSSLLEVGTGFHPELTGRENIYLNGAILGMKKKEIQRKFDKIVDFAEISKFLDTPVKHYSSGMYVRLAFAVAAHLDPEILIVDEVLSVGDASFQKKCLRKMSTVGQNQTVIFVSHNMVAIKSLCKRVILLDKGKIIMSGETNEVVNRYIDGGEIGTFERTWPDKKLALQNESLIITKVRVADQRGHLSKRIDTDTPFNVELYYQVKKNNSYIGMTLVFYDNENNCILSTINNHEKKWYGKPMMRGNYKSVCHIPKNFLNYGYFNLSLNIFGHNFSDSAQKDEILNLEILDGTQVRGDYYGGFSGHVRPLFDWVTFKEKDKSK